MLKYKHLSIDIETLGTTPGSIALSVGAVAFGLAEPVTEDEEKVLDIRISVTDSLINGLTADEATLTWWRKQSSDARAALDLGQCVTIAGAHNLLKGYMLDHCTDGCKVWMKGPSFDGLLLNEAFKAVAQKPLWKFWEERDVRTICDGIPEPQRIGVHHKAVDDAIHQAKWVRSALLSKEVLEAKD